MQKVDYIIVGQGLAGTMIAHFLDKAGYSFIAYDIANSHAASRVAGGLMNPVTGKRMVKGWKVDELIPFAKKTFMEIEEKFKLKIIDEKPQLKFFSNPEDLKFYEEKKDDEAITPFVKTLPNTIDTEKYVNADLGGVSIHGCVQVNCGLLVDAYNEYLKKEGKLFTTGFDYTKVNLSETGKVTYEGYQAKGIIFCEGPGVLKNPWFNDIALQPSKGETLTIKIKGLPDGYIWKKGVFLLAKNRDEFYVGSTNSWKYEGDLPTDEKREELIKRLKKTLKLDFEIIEQNSGIRPNSKDRRPLIGFHPEFKQLSVFNGLGTKGISLSPYLASQFVKGLADNLQPDREINYQRFNLVKGKNQN